MVDSASGIGSPKVFEKTEAAKNVLTNLKNMVTSADAGNTLLRRHSADSHGASSTGKLKKGPPLPPRPICPGVGIDGGKNTLHWIKAPSDPDGRPDKGEV